MLFKLIFGAVTMTQMASFAGKLKVIADQKGPERVHRFENTLKGAIIVSSMLLMTYLGLQVHFNNEKY
jgi:hypothetical protein